MAENKPDYIVKLRTEDKGSSGRFGWYTVGCAYKNVDNINIVINFPAPFIVDPNAKIVLMPNINGE